MFVLAAGIGVTFHSQSGPDAVTLRTSQLGSGFVVGHGHSDRLLVVNRAVSGGLKSAQLVA
jgi:hypothetical protein